MDEKYNQTSFIEEEISVLKEYAPKESRVSCISVILDESGKPMVDISFEPIENNRKF